MGRALTAVAPLALLYIAASPMATPGEGASAESRGAAKAEISAMESEIVERRLESVKVLFRMDANRDGVLHAEEVPEGAESFVSSVAEEGELDPGKPLDLHQLTGRIRDLARARFEQSIRAVIGEDSSSHTAVNSDGKFTRRVALKHFDVNRDGVIDQYESAEMSEEQNAALGDELADRFLEALAVCKHMDANRDGLLHPDEVPEPLKPYVERVGRNAGAESFTGPWRLQGLEKRLQYLAYSARRKKLAEAAADSAEPASRPARESTSRTSVEKQYADRNTARKHAGSLLNLYDENGDEVLEPKEWMHLSDDWRRADRNRDGKLTTEEIADRMVRYAQVETGSPGSVQTHRATSRDRTAGAQRPRDTTPSRYSIYVRWLPEGLPAWFLQRDANRDGQVQMSEFSETWDEPKAAEFRRYDVNDDGFITPKECLATAGSTGETK